MLYLTQDDAVYVDIIYHDLRNYKDIFVITRVLIAGDD